LLKNCPTLLLASTGSILNKKLMPEKPVNENKLFSKSIGNCCARTKGKEKKKHRNKHRIDLMLYFFAKLQPNHDA